MSTQAEQESEAKTRAVLDELVPPTAQALIDMTAEDPDCNELAFSYLEEDSQDWIGLLAETFAAGVRLAHVEQIDLSGSKIFAEETADFTARVVPHLGNITALDMRDNRMGPNGWAALQAGLAEHCPKLIAIELSENLVRDAGARTAAVYLKSGRPIDFIGLGSNGLTHLAATVLRPALAHAAHLTDLRLEFNALGDEGCVTLARGVARCPSLRQLNLSDNAIGDDGAVALCEMIERAEHELEFLNVSVNRIGARGAAAVSEMLTRTRHLQNLDIANNPLTDGGAALLAAGVPHWASLEILDLICVDVPDSVVATIAENLKHNNVLKLVRLYNNERVTGPTFYAMEAMLKATEGRAAPKSLPMGRRGGQEGKRAEQPFAVPRAVIIAGIVAVAAIVALRFVGRK